MTLREWNTYTGYKDRFSTLEGLKYVFNSQYAVLTKMRNGALRKYRLNRSTHFPALMLFNYNSRRYEIISELYWRY
jgi:hypothetical protein